MTATTSAALQLMKCLYFKMEGSVVTRLQVAHWRDFLLFFVLAGEAGRFGCAVAGEAGAAVFFAGRDCAAAGVPVSAGWVAARLRGERAGLLSAAGVLAAPAFFERAGEPVAAAGAFLGAAAAAVSVFFGAAEMGEAADEAPFLCERAGELEGERAAAPFVGAVEVPAAAGAFLWERTGELEGERAAPFVAAVEPVAAAVVFFWWERAGEAEGEAASGFFLCDLEGDAGALALEAGRARGDWTCSWLSA
jgi:hypothetical protein